MGLIEKLVSDLIRQSTGINARGAVRRIGGGKLLMAGGLAAAGALLADKAGGGGSPAAAAGSGGYAYTKSPARPAGAHPEAPPPAPPPGSVPPPPGSPRQVAPPPPPPQPPAPAAGADSATGDLTFAAARTAVAAALADGELTAAEREAVERHVADSELTPEQAARVHGDLLQPATPRELAALAPGPEERRALYELAALLQRADREVSDVEREWLDAFADALEIAPEQRDALEAEVFATDDSED